jgi:hypothetical protein
VTDAGDTSEVSESPAMRAFLAKRRVDVLRKAVATLETCSDDDLPSEAHRLAGTLGIFGFDDASIALRSLQRTAEDTQNGSDVIDGQRTRTLAMLRGITNEVTSEEPE